MDKRDTKLDRLLRGAAASAETSLSEMPFGFETRVLAHWRAERSKNGTAFWEMARIFRRIALGAAIIALCASSAAYWQFEQNDELDEPASNAYAIADSAIEIGAFQ